jgi:hypothetical protein
MRFGRVLKTESLLVEPHRLELTDFTEKIG